MSNKILVRGLEEAERLLLDARDHLSNLSFAHNPDGELDPTRLAKSESSIRKAQDWIRDIKESLK